MKEQTLPLTEILRQLVAFKTVSRDLAANHRALDYVEAFVAERGMKTKRVESNGHGSLIATTRETKTPKVFLAAHVDVVPAPEELFTLREERGILYGRGTYDMKFAIAAYMQVVETLKDSLGDYDFGLMITTDEELAGQDGTGFLVNEGYVPEITVLPDGGQDWAIEESAKGFCLCKVTATGVTAHSSRSWEGESATEKLIEFLHDMKRLFPAPSVDTTTTNVGIIKGGEAANQVASAAEALFDIRFPSSAAFTKAREKIAQLAKEHGVVCEEIRVGDVYITDQSNPYVETFRQALTKVLGRDPGTSKSLGGSDAVYFARRGVTSIVVRPPGGGMHGDDEWIDAAGVSELHDVLKIFLEHAALCDR